jgi:uncharacterized protein YdaU (DUF1376 family)
MAKAPAFQLYAADLIMDTQDWTDEELGAHIRLMCWSWVNRRGIPRDTQRLTRIAPGAEKCWAVIGSKWVEGPDGTWVNERLENTRSDSDAFRAKQREKSLLAVEKRKANTVPTGLTTDKPTEVSKGQPTGSPTGDPLEGEEEDTVLIQERKEREIKTPFETWWLIYGKGSRKLSAELWAKMPEQDRVACIAKTPAYTASKPDPLFRKDGERFLKHRTWEDPIVSYAKPTATDQRRSTTSDRDKPITIGQRQTTAS